jgi:predicted  nucleic acid-binding Zn-ribbon protein
MHTQLETLLEIQDLKTQRRELEATTEERQVEQEVFNMRVEDALTELDRRIADMVVSLDPAVRSRYERLVGRRPRAVVPVIGGTCYGCFVAVPTAVSSSAERNEEIRYCDHCGRFLYIID